MYRQYRFITSVKASLLLIVITTLVAIGIASQVYADQQEGALSNKYIEAEAAFEEVITSVSYDYGRLNELTESGLGRGSVFSVIYRYSASIYAKREPEHAVDYLIWRITQPNARGAGFSESKYIASMCLGGLARNDPEAVHAIDKLFREGGEPAVYILMSTIENMPIRERQELVGQWVKEWLASDGDVHMNWSMSRVLHELRIAGSPEMIEVLDDILKGEYENVILSTDVVDSIHKVIAAIRSREGMDDETLEKEAYFAEVLSEAGTNVVGHVTGGTGIRVSEKIVYQATVSLFDDYSHPFDRRIPVDVLISYVDGSRPYATDDQVYAAIAFLGFSKDPKAILILRELANSEDPYISGPAKLALIDGGFEKP